MCVSDVLLGMISQPSIGAKNVLASTRTVLVPANPWRVGLILGISSTSANGRVFPDVNVDLPSSTQGFGLTNLPTTFILSSKLHGGLVTCGWSAWVGSGAVQFCWTESIIMPEYRELFAQIMGKQFGADAEKAVRAVAGAKSPN